MVAVVAPMAGPGGARGHPADPSPAVRLALVASVLAAHGLAAYALLQADAMHDSAREVVPIFAVWVAPAPPRAAPAPPPVRPHRRVVDEPMIASAPPTPPAVKVPAAEPLPATPAAPSLAATSVPSPAPAPAAAPAPAPTPSHTVDAREVGYLTPPRPTYPAVSRRLGEEGRVTLRVLVDAAGLPVQVIVSASSGYARLDDAALHAARGARFRPYAVDGIAQPVWVLVPFVFSLNAG